MILDWRNQDCKITVLPKTIYGFDAMHIKLQRIFLTKLEELEHNIFFGGGILEMCFYYILSEFSRQMGQTIIVRWKLGLQDELTLQFKSLSFYDLDNEKTSSDDVKFKFLPALTFYELNKILAFKQQKIIRYLTCVSDLCACVNAYV